MQLTNSRQNLSVQPLLILPILILLFTYGCAGKKPSHPAPGHTRPYEINGKWYRPIPEANGYRERGIASWYGAKFHGRKTANGEIYNMHAMTAAHKTLPLGTYVRVTSIENGKQADVRINDRGPFVRGRIIDLSYRAAKKIGVVGPGTARVEIVALGSGMPSGQESRADAPAPSVDFNTGSFSFQVGAFKNRRAAENQRRHLSKKYRDVSVSSFDSGSGIYYRVRVGKFSSLRHTKKYEQILIRDGYVDAFVVAE